MMAGLLLRALCRPLAPRAEVRKTDAIVVLGSNPGPTLDERVRAGVELFRAGWAPRLVLTGVAPEAPTMAKQARSLGVPADALVIEDRARSTRENAHHSARLLREAGLRKVVVVTTPYHLRRSLAFFRRAGLEATPYYIADSRIFAGGRESARALRWVIREYVLLLHYRLRGQL